MGLENWPQLRERMGPASPQGPDTSSMRTSLLGWVKGPEDHVAELTSPPAFIQDRTLLETYCTRPRGTEVEAPRWFCHVTGLGTGSLFTMV